MSGPIVGIDHVQVAAPPGSEDEARRFYGVLLGLPEVVKPAGLAARGGVWFRVGGHELHIGIAEPFAPAGKAHPAFRLSSRPELVRLAGRLEAAGTAVQWADPAEIPGRSRFFALDPWGNRLELLV